MKCKDCKYFKGSTGGECFRYPPVALSEFVHREYSEQIEVTTHRPYVGCEEESCGEFISKEAA